MRKKSNIKEKKASREEPEVLGGSSAKCCQSNRNPEVLGVEDEIDCDEDRRQEQREEIGEIESGFSSDSGDLTVSVLSCDSATQKKDDDFPSPPSGWFFSLIIVWALMGPLSEEPATYTSVAGTSTDVGNGVGKPTTLAGIKEAAANSATVSIGEASEGPKKVKMLLADHQMDKKLKLMEKSLAVAESTSEHIKSLNAEVALDASIKRKEKSIIILLASVAIC